MKVMKLNGVLRNLKNIKINEIKNEYFLNFFDVELVKYIFIIIKEENEKYKALKFLYANDILTLNKYREKMCENRFEKIWTGKRFSWNGDALKYKVLTAYENPTKSK